MLSNGTNIKPKKMKNVLHTGHGLRGSPCPTTKSELQKSTAAGTKERCQKAIAPEVANE